MLRLCFQTARRLLLGGFLLSVLPVPTWADDLPPGIRLLPVEQGDIHVPLSAQDREEFTEFSGQVAPAEIVCSADVSIPVLDDMFPAAPAINAALAARAEEARCNSQRNTSWLKPEGIAVQGRIFSVTFMVMPYPLDGNGSCHGWKEGWIFNVDTGERYTLAALVPERQRAALTADILRYYRQLRTEDGRAPSAVDLNLLEQNLFSRWAEQDIYLSGRTLYFNPRLFLFSCVDGNDYPYAISPAFLADEARAAPILGILR